MALTKERELNELRKILNTTPSAFSDEQLQRLVQLFTKKAVRLRGELEESRENYKSNSKLSGRARMALKACIFLLLAAALVWITVTFAPPLFVVLLAFFTLMVLAVKTSPIPTMLSLTKKKLQLSLTEDLLGELTTVQQSREQANKEQPNQVAQSTVNNTYKYGSLYVVPDKQVGDLSFSSEQSNANVVARR